MISKSSQTIKANVPVEIAIPSDYVLVKKVVLEDYKERANQVTGIWDIKDVAKYLRTSTRKVSSRILNNPKYELERNQLEIAGVIKKRPSKNSPWYFAGPQFKAWLDRHMPEFDFSES